MHILKEQDYSLVKPLLSDIPINTLFAQMITEKKRAGTIFVDAPQNPASCLIVNSYGMLLLTGKTNNGRFNADVADYMLTNKATKTYWLQAYPDAWHGKIETLLGSHLVDYAEFKQNAANDGQDLEDAANRLMKTSVIKWGRTNFKFNHQKYYAFQKPEIPAGLTIRRVDEELFKNIEGTVVPKYFWDSYNDFEDNGTGFSLTQDNTVIATCFHAFKIGNNYEISIETNAAYRQKGYAEIVAAALIDYCLDNNYEPVWSCRTENIGSYLLAQKLGFEITYQLPYYSLVKK